jgi:hypothetical protein
MEFKTIGILSMIRLKELTAESANAFAEELNRRLNLW